MAKSSLPSQRTIPAFCISAFTAWSELVKAPVCDEAARLPASELPAFIAAIRQPFFIRDCVCLRNLSGFAIFSIYSNFILGSLLGSKFLSIYSKTSSTPICALLPTDQILLNVSPLGIADSIIKTAVAPEPEIISIPFGSNFGIGVVNTPA